MKTMFIEEKFNYDGSQLRSLFAYLDYKLLGDSIVSWVGPCNIPEDKMVDGEDLLDNQEIRSNEMLHFICEIFDRDLFSAVCLQRLFADMAITTLKSLSPKKEMTNQLVREGDDIFLESKKLSISVATVSPSSTLFHFALNTTNEGTPVETLCLADLEVKVDEFSKNLMVSFIAEYDNILDATKKVKWVF